jgi:hypothetical protein
MLDQVAAAFDRQDYQTATRLLKELSQQSPQNPWVKLYLARLREVSGNLDSAENLYRKLLQDTTNLKLVVQVRQGLQRIEQLQQERRQQTIAEAKADPQTNEPGFLALKSVAGELRAAAIANFARVMHLDTYTARGLLPSRGWRLYRTGSVGELQVYGQELRRAGVPAISVSSSDVQRIHLFRVHYVQATTPQAIAICQNEQDQMGSLSFDWAEVSQRVDGMVPIFEQVVDLGYRDQLERKEKTQDYAHFCDLHLPGRGCILRIQDGTYAFEQGISLPGQQAVTDLDRSTIRTNWNCLMQLLNQQLPEIVSESAFTTFAETAADFAICLNRLKSHIHLLRQMESYWDPAFHLYSSLIFLQGSLDS